MNPIITIRRLTQGAADLAALLEIEHASFNKYDAYSPADFSRWLAYNPELCLAAEIEQQMVGYVITRILPAEGSQKACGDLASLAISPAFRRCRVGRALLEASVKILKNAGVGQITLEVRRRNYTGFSFWSRMGFIPFGELPGFYEDGEDAVCMKKIFC